MTSWLCRALLALAVGCGGAAHESGPGPVESPAGAAEPPALSLVESYPVETTLGNRDIPDAHDVWLEMINGAQRTIDFAQFYASGRAASRLQPIVDAVVAAAARGVKVRFLSSAGFAKTYPDTLAVFRRTAGIDVRLIDGSRYGGDGVLHAKYFVVDGSDAFLGSQNFDWRALTHIQELGVRTPERVVARGLARVFEFDWQLADTNNTLPDPPPVPPAWDGRLTFVASPRSALPAGIAWDLPKLVEMIRSARRTVRIQLLSYRDDIDQLTDALVAAGRRGVDVRVLVSHWNVGRRRVGALKKLADNPGVTVGFATIPTWSGGFVPYARVIHAKYLVADGRRFWIGTSNWSRRYFFDSRNVGLIADDSALGARLDRYFANLWDSEYRTTVEQDAIYPEPRRE